MSLSLPVFPLSLAQSRILSGVMAAYRRVVIDDFDSRINYTGQGWFQDQGSQDGVGIYGPVYRHTSHGTNNNDSFSFSFEGTSISSMGTMGLLLINNFTARDPTWECLVDHIKIGSYGPIDLSENNLVLCEQTTLNDGPHTLQVNVKTAGKTFWLDSLLFTPSPQASLDGAVLRVENTDPGIVLDSKWKTIANTGNMTTEKGSQAKFDFVGRSVTWFGYILLSPPSPAACSYSIDGGPPTRFILNGPALNSTSAYYNQVLFTTPDLEPGPHSLVVVYDGAEGPATPLTLDYLYVTNTSTLQSARLNSSGTSSPSPTDTSPGGQVQQRSLTPIGAIAGGGVGGLALIALVVLLLFLCRRRRQHRRGKLLEDKGSSADGGTPSREVSQVTPFVPPAGHPPTFVPLALQPHGLRNGAQHRLLGPSGTYSTFNQSHVHTGRVSCSNPNAFAGVAQLRPVHKDRDIPQPIVAAVLQRDDGVQVLQRDVLVRNMPPGYTIT